MVTPLSSLTPHLIQNPPPISSNELWHEAETLPLSQEQFNRWQAVINKKCILQPNNDFNPIEFYFHDLILFIENSISINFQGYPLVYHSFIAGGTVAHIANGEEYSDINFRLYFNNPTPLEYIRSYISQYFSIKLQELYPDISTSEELRLFLLHYLNKCTIKYGPSTSFCWFGIGDVDFKCYYTKATDAHILANQEALMIHTSTPYFCYPKGNDSSLETSLDLINRKVWRPNFTHFEGNPRHFFEMTLHRLTQGYHIEELHLLLPMLERELNTILSTTPHWMIRNFIPFLERHYPKGTPLERQQSFCLLNTLTLIQTLDPDNQNPSINDLKEALATHFKRLANSTSCFIPLTHRLDGSYANLNEELSLFKASQLYLPPAIQRYTNAYLHIPFKIGDTTKLSHLWIPETLQMFMTQWVEHWINAHDTLDTHWHAAYATPSSDSRRPPSMVVFTETIEHYINYELALISQRLAPPEKEAQLFSFILNLKQQIDRVPDNAILQEIINELCIIFIKAPIQEDVNLYLQRFFYILEENEVALTHFLKLAITHSFLAPNGLYALVAEFLQSKLSKNEPLPASVILYLLENKILWKKQITEEVVSSILTNIKLIPQEVHSSILNRLFENYLHLDKHLKNGNEKLKLLEKISVLLEVFPHYNEENSLFISYLSLYQRTSSKEVELALHHQFNIFFKDFCYNEDKAALILSKSKLLITITYALRKDLFLDADFYRSILFLFEYTMNNKNYSDLSLFLNFLTKEPDLWCAHFFDKTSFLSSFITRNASKLPLRYRETIAEIINARLRRCTEKEAALTALIDKESVEGLFIDETSEEEKLVDLLFIHEQWPDETNAQRLSAATSTCIEHASPESAPLLQKVIYNSLKDPLLQDQAHSWALTFFLLPTRIFKKMAPLESLQLLTQSTHEEILPLNSILKQELFFLTHSDTPPSQPLMQELTSFNLRGVENYLSHRELVSRKEFNTFLHLIKKIEAFTQLESSLETLQLSFARFILDQSPEDSLQYLQQSNPWIPVCLKSAPTLTLRLLEPNAHLSFWLQHPEYRIKKVAEETVKNLEMHYLKSDENYNNALPHILEYYQQSKPKETKGLIFRVTTQLQDDFLSLPAWNLFFTEVISQLPGEHFSNLGTPWVTLLKTLTEKGFLDSLSEHEALTLFHPLRSYILNIKKPKLSDISDAIALLTPTLAFESIENLTADITHFAYMKSLISYQQVLPLYELRPENPLFHIITTSLSHDINTKINLLLSDTGQTAIANYSLLPTNIRKVGEVQYCHLYLENIRNKLQATDSNPDELLAIELDSIDSKILLLKEEPDLIVDPDFLLDLEGFEEYASFLKTYCQRDIPQMNTLLKSFFLKLLHKQFSFSTEAIALAILQLIGNRSFPLERNGDTLDLKLLMTIIKSASNTLECFNPDELEYMQFFNSLILKIFEEKSDSEGDIDLACKTSLQFLEGVTISKETSLDESHEQSQLFILVANKYIFKKPKEVFACIGRFEAHFLSEESSVELEQKAIFHAIPLTDDLYTVPFKSEFLKSIAAFNEYVKESKNSYLESPPDELPDTFNLPYFINQILEAIRVKKEETFELMQTKMECPIFLDHYRARLNEMEELVTTQITMRGQTLPSYQFPAELPIESKVVQNS